MNEMMRQALIFACAMCVVLAVALPQASAQSSCSNTNNVSVTSATSITVTPAYQPFSGSALTHSFSLTVQNNNNSPCSVALFLVRPTAPLVMASGAFSLTYNLEFNGNNAVDIGTPATGVSMTAPANGTVTFSTYSLTLPANQTSAAAGTYFDDQIVLDLYAYKNGRGWRSERTYALSLGASIDKTCVMQAPSPATLNFTSAISLGIPNPGNVFSSNISGVNCTSPSRITLSGNAMQHTPSVAPTAGFDSFIDWRATATLGSATATLATNAASTVTSANYNVPSGTTVGGTLGVDVNLLAGQRLRSGNYTGVLTVTVDPTL